MTPSSGGRRGEQSQTFVVCVHHNFVCHEETKSAPVAPPQFSVIDWLPMDTCAQLRSKSGGGSRVRGPLADWAIHQTIRLRGRNPFALVIGAIRAQGAISPPGLVRAQEEMRPAQSLRKPERRT